jgi:hypothetical protein
MRATAKSREALESELWQSKLTVRHHKLRHVLVLNHGNVAIVLSKRSVDNPLMSASQPRRIFTVVTVGYATYESKSALETRNRK